VNVILSSAEKFVSVFETSADLIVYCVWIICPGAYNPPAGAITLCPEGIKI
jgi:hypothetical protein